MYTDIPKTSPIATEREVVLHALFRRNSSLSLSPSAEWGTIYAKDGFAEYSHSVPGPHRSSHKTETGMPHSRVYDKLSFRTSGARKKEKVNTMVMFGGSNDE